MYIFQILYQIDHYFFSEDFNQYSMIKPKGMYIFIWASFPFHVNLTFVGFLKGWCLFNVTLFNLFEAFSMLINQLRSVCFQIHNYSRFYYTSVLNIGPGSETKNIVIAMFNHMLFYSQLFEREIKMLKPYYCYNYINFSYQIYIVFNWHWSEIIILGWRLSVCVSHFWRFVRTTKSISTNLCTKHFSVKFLSEVPCLLSIGDNLN